MWFTRNEPTDHNADTWRANKMIHSMQECPLCSSDTLCGVDTAMLYRKPNQTRKTCTTMSIRKPSRRPGTTK